MWTRFRVQWKFVTRLCGSIPSDPELVKAWLESRKPKVKPPDGKSIPEIQEEVMQSLMEKEAEESLSQILTFQKEAGICCMRAGTIKSHLKDCARVLSNQYIGRVTGERAFSTRVINGVFTDEQQYWVPILRPNGDAVKAPDGTQDKAVRVRGYSALKQFEFIQPARLDFTLKVLTAKGQKPGVTKNDLQLLMEYGGVHGYGGERGDGEGRYTFTLTEEK